MLSCRRCCGGHIRRAEISWSDAVGYMILLRPYRCLSCGLRFRHLLGQPLMVDIAQRERRKRELKRRQAELWSACAGQVDAWKIRLTGDRSSDRASSDLVASGRHSDPTNRA